ncbi:hypothetical protein [Sorangium atrum]|uniref:Uncharacterized protein n=1 Tax=Sorangium atrum TaxID=2995308 RepID=A0ABT5BTZ9_9BACT|nr:hypothetical protein [Sorangium aterium]MDC0677024.1 hypothetical protein [Sorangium aterium]
MMIDAKEVAALGAWSRGGAVADNTSLATRAAVLVPEQVMVAIAFPARAAGSWLSAGAARGVIVFVVRDGAFVAQDHGARSAFLHDHAVPTAGAADLFAIVVVKVRQRRAKMLLAAVALLDGEGGAAVGELTFGHDGLVLVPRTGYGSASGMPGPTIAAS